MNKNLLILLCLLLPAAAPAQTTKRLTASKANEYGLVYNLPRTAVDITIEAEHEQSRPGEFSNYARRHLSIDNAITEPVDNVTIRSVTVVPRGVADPANRWQVQFKSGSTPYIILDENGVLLSVNTEQRYLPDAPKLPKAVAAQPTPLETDAARQAVTQEMTRGSSVSKRAELAAQRVFELREMRSDLLSGQADNTPPDGKAMQLVLDNISAQEAALTAMFAGTTRRFTTVNTFTFVPDSIDRPETVIARLSPIDGLVGPDDLSGAPITLTASIVERATMPVNDNGSAKTFPKGGLAYTIPGTVHISLKFDGREIWAGDVPVAQAGVTFGLDPSLFTDKKAPSKLLLSPATGAIIELGPAD